MKFKYLILYLALVSLALLYLLSLFSSPVQISMRNVSDYSGQKVAIQGIVTAYRTTSFGSQLITLRDVDNDTCSVLVYLEGEISIQYGDIIQAVGEVQRYKDQWEVMVSNPQFISILQRWNNQVSPLWQLAEHPNRYLDTNINVTGIITQKQTASFILTDETKKYLLHVSCNAVYCAPFSNDDSVAVAGRFIYDSSSFRYILQVTEQNQKSLSIRE
jgi:hypothetical protein